MADLFAVALWFNDGCPPGELERFRREAALQWQLTGESLERECRRHDGAVRALGRASRRRGMVPA